MNQSKKVQIRNGFSDRMKIRPLNREMQVTDFDLRTRIALANLICDWIHRPEFNDRREEIYKSIAKNAFNEFLSDELETEIHYHESEFINTYILSPITDESYDQVLSLTEYIVSLLKTAPQMPRIESYWNVEHYKLKENHFSFEQSLNQLFEKEFVGYRMIAGLITPITNETEMNSIKSALHNKYEGCRTRISKALSLLSNRENPDYKNSIKESISAVESICQVIVNDDKATLGKALNKLKENGLELHPALIKAFSELYGYTSDQGGIRHAKGMFESNVSFADAKYMLVSCSAFVNYLITLGSR